MDKLSEHAIRMLEIADANDIPVLGNSQFRDISRAVYDLILQVQMLKEVNRKENSSEKPNNCKGCIYLHCGMECGDSEDEPQNHSGEATEMVEPQTDDGTAFIKRHGLRVDCGDEVPYDLKPFIDW